MRPADHVQSIQIVIIIIPDVCVPLDVSGSRIKVEDAALTRRNIYHAPAK